MDVASRARELALLGIEVRATQSENTGTGGGYQPPHVPAGSSKGGQFGTTAGTSTTQPGYKSILPPDSAYSSGSGKKKAAAPVPSGTPQPPAEPRTMKAGDSGEDVRYAQYAMNLLGFKVPQDGQYGPETEAAVKQMQERLGVKKPNGHLSPSMLHKMQDAVRLSPCVGAGQRDLAFEAQWEQRDSDEAEDDEPDETAQAILDAIDEVVQRSAGADWDERAHDVSKELRIPGHHEGGGRWTAGGITKAIAKALEDWSRGDGPDDPFTLDGKPIDREPLRKAAVARGITLKRGAPREDIVKALLDDVRAGVAAKKAQSPRLPGVGKDHRRFTIQHAGTATDVGIFGNPSTGKLSLYRESDTGKRTGRAIKSFDDMGALEAWARDNGHTELADYAKAEQAKAAPKVAPPANVRDELAKAGVDIQPDSLREAAVKRAESGNTADLHNLAKHLRDASQTQRGLASMRLGNNAPGSLQHNKGQQNLDEAGRLEDAARAIEKLAGGPVPKEPPPTSVHEPKRGVTPVPIAAVFRPGASSDSGTWKVDRFDGLEGGDRGAAAAVTEYLRRPFFVNDRLRFGEAGRPRDPRLPPVDPKDAAKADRQIAALDRVMAQSHTAGPMRTWRGVRLEDIGIPSGDAAGHTWTDKGFASTSTRRGVAEHSFSGNGSALLEIHSPEGTPALQIDGLGETEVLLGRGQTYRVVADHGLTSSGARHLEVEVVPAKAEQARVGGAPSAPAAKKAAKAAPGKAVEPSSALTTDELTAIGEVHALGGSGTFANKGWVHSDALSPLARRHADGLVAKGVLQKDTAADGVRYRIDPRGMGGREGAAPSGALTGDVLPAQKAAESRLSLTKLNRGAIIEGHIGKGGTFGNDATPGSRPVRVVVQRIEPLDQNGDPIKLNQPGKAGAVGGLEHFHFSGEKPQARIIGHDVETGRRVESDVVPANSSWSWHMNPEGNTSADIEGELATPKSPIGSGAPDPATILSSLPADLTPAQKRARLRSRGVPKEQIDALVPLAPRKKAARALDLLGVTRALGHDVTPGHDELHHYWTVGPGLAKWAESPKPWTTLVAHLTKYVGPEKAKIYASRWFIEVFHFAAGSDLNRVTHGKPPRGHRVGPG
jgi:hypothetical protein